jgi:hypothetical protein
MSLHVIGKHTGSASRPQTPPHALWAHAAETSTWLEQQTLQCADASGAPSLCKLGGALARRLGNGCVLTCVGKSCFGQGY